MIRSRFSILLLLAITARGFAMTASNEGVPLTVEQRVAELYRLAAQDVNELAARAMRELAASPESRSATFREIRAAQLGYQIRQRLDRMGVETEGLLVGPTESAVRAAIKRGDEELAEAELGPQPFAPGININFAQVDDEAVRAIARDTAAIKAGEVARDMRGAIAQHGDNAERVFRAMSDSVLTRSGGEAKVNDAIARGIVSGDPRITERAIRDLFRDPNSAVAVSYRKLGNQQIQVGKATMNVRQYASTLTRTRMREATVAARHDRLSSRGVRLVQITGRQSVNFCTAFVGLVCSIDGSTEVEGMQVIPLSDLPGGGPPFHPNCSKGTAAYIPSLVSAGRRESAARQFTVYQERKRNGSLLDPVD